MQLAYFAALYIVGLLLDLLVIAALLRNGSRRYAFIQLYLIADFLTTVIEIKPAFAYGSATVEEQKVFNNLYWWDERIMQVLVFTLVISLLYDATTQMRPRRALLAGAVFGTVIFAVVTFFIEFSPHLPSWEWVTFWTRDLNFGSALLDLGLWAMLIGAREKDYRLLMVTGALGLKFTGGAIAQAFRGMSPAWQEAANYFLGLANLACLYIWWQAFRTPAPKPLPSDAAKATLKQK